MARLKPESSAQIAASPAVITPITLIGWWEVGRLSPTATSTIPNTSAIPMSGMPVTANRALTRWTRAAETHTQCGWCP